MTALEEIMKTQIAASGPMDIGTFMALALGHPEHGYYNTRDPFGKDGDFITAPEISQMFGELIGVWVADCWARLGSPERFILLECGPGRGTLMADALRATKGLDGFHGAAEVHLLEMSPVLRKAQEAALKDYDVVWHESLENVPDDAPILVVANEFFDALPARQLVRSRGAWHERVIGIEEGVLAIGVKACPMAMWPQFGNPQEGDVFEFSPARENFMAALIERVSCQEGAALVIDYGHLKSAYGDTLQCVSNHEFGDVLHNIGEVDMTSHVDFEVLGNACEKQNVSHRFTTQGEFLQALGIGIRGAALQKAGGETIEKDLQRLVARDQMGELFKVMGIYHGIEGEHKSFWAGF